MTDPNMLCFEAENMPRSGPVRPKKCQLGLSEKDGSAYSSGTGSYPLPGQGLFYSAENPAQGRNR